MIKLDYRAAGIDLDDNGSGRLVFHSLRHTFGTMLAAVGVHPKVAQDLMRHSDINLTMSRYTHTLKGQQAAAIESLPDFGRDDPNIQKATGTDGQLSVIVPDIPTKSTARIPAKSCEQQRILAEVDGSKEGRVSGNENDKHKKTAF